MALVSVVIAFVEILHAIACDLRALANIHY